MKADRNVKKFGGGHILRRICGSQNSAANSARRNFSVGFSADKIFCSEFGGGWGSNQASVAVASAAAAAAATGAGGRVCSGWTCIADERTEPASDWRGTSVAAFNRQIITDSMQRSILSAAAVICMHGQDCRQWCIANNAGGYTQTGVAKGLKVPCLFMIAEVHEPIRCQKTPDVGIRHIPAYTPNTPLTTASLPL